MSWEDLAVEVLSEFADVGRYSAEDWFASMSEHITRRTEQHKKDCQNYQQKKSLDPAWRAMRTAKQTARNRAKGIPPRVRLTEQQRAENRKKRVRRKVSL